MASPAFLPAYLVVGADEFKRQFVIERLNKQIAKLGDLDFNREVFQGASTDADALVTSCNTLPFSCDYRLVMVRDADKMPKATNEAVVSYLAAPSETTILCLEATKLAKNTRLYKAVAKVGKKAVIDCAPKSRKDLPAQVRDFALSNGVTITQRGAEELIDLVGESTVHLDAELKKMAAVLGKGTTIDVGQVDELVTRTSEVKPWTLSDALAKRDAKEAALLLSRMQDQSRFGLLTMCLNRIRELLVAKDLHSGSARALAQELGKQEWQVRNLPRWAGNFTQRELEDALVKGADLDRAMKSGGDQELLFEQWVLGICARPAHGREIG